MRTSHAQWRCMMLGAVGLLVVLLATTSCSGVPATESSAAPAPRRSDPTLSAALEVSAPVGPGGGSAVGEANASLVGEAVAYVSLMPGTIPDGGSVSIRNMRTSAGATTLVINGGFDPQAIAANAGDTLDVGVTHATGLLTEAFVVVAAPHPPKVVRTDPLKGETDVSVNTSLAVVFSEPVDPATVTTISVALRLGVTPVTGTVQIVPGLPYTVEFVPDAPLAHATDYTLTVQGTITDLSGQTLDTGTTVSFSTAPLIPNPVASVSVTPAVISLPVGQLIQLNTVVQDGNANILSGRPIVWSSSNPAVATVSGVGIVAGIAAGSVTLSATAEGKSGTATATITAQAATSVGIESPAGTLIAAGLSAQLTAETEYPRDANGNIPLGLVCNATWSSSNPAVATVTQAGLVTSAATGGSVTIMAVCGGVSGTIALTFVVAQSIDLSGSVMGDDGVPVPNARIQLDYVGADHILPYGLGGSEFAVMGDAGGSYHIDFAPIPDYFETDASHHYAAHAMVEGSGYDVDFRYVSASAPSTTKTFILHRTRQIGPGDSAFVTVSPDDAQCVNNVQDMYNLGPFYLCRTVHVIATSAGILTLEGVAAGGGAPPLLEVENVNGSLCCDERLENPTSITVVAGTDVRVEIEMPATSTASQTFLLKTSMGSGPSTRRIP